MSKPHRDDLSSEGTLEISQPQGGWNLAQNVFQVPEGQKERWFSAVPSGRNFLRAVFQPLRSWLISGCRSATPAALATMILFLAVAATAETTNALSKAEVEGHELARQLCAAQPAENFTNIGVLKIRAAAGKRGIPVNCTVVVTPTNWVSVYVIRNDWGTESLAVQHESSETNHYHYHLDFGDSAKNKTLSGDETILAFANSDFWLCDLGLEFFHWPAQKILKKEVKRSRGCTVLESTNPNPSTNSYSRVVSWIDRESGGIVQAEAYDFQNKLLKEFEPRRFRKVEGQWQLQEMEIRNVQTGSRTRLEFDAPAE